jgi:hypothetical protein
VTELLAALSFGADLGLGHPTEHVLRQTYIALHLAERLAMDEQEREVDHWRAASAFSEDLGLSDAVRDSVVQTFEAGMPRGTRWHQRRGESAATFENVVCKHCNHARHD